MNILDQITEEYKRSDIPNFNVGDTVRVHIKIKEGTRERIQIFEGFVLKRQNGGVSETFTVRRIASGVGVEKTFPIHSPRIEKIEVVKNGDVRKAKLNYMRQRTGKSAKIKAKILTDDQIKAEEEAMRIAREEEAAREEARKKAKAESDAKVAANAAEGGSGAEAEEKPAKAETEEKPVKEEPAEAKAEEKPEEATSDAAEETSEEKSE